MASVFDNAIGSFKDFFQSDTYHRQVSPPAIGMLVQKLSPLIKEKVFVIKLIPCQTPL